MRKLFKDFKYSDLTSCNESYPYIEENDSKAISCKQEIKQRLKTFLACMNDIGLVGVFDFRSHSYISIEELHDDDFLFYSYENGKEEEQYLVATTGEKYDSVADWCNSDASSVLILNDSDGIGIGIAGSEKVFRIIDNFRIPWWNEVDSEEFICWQD